MDGLTPKPPDGPEGTDNSPVGRAFPTDPAEFGNDERCSFSKPDDAWLMETEDGEEYLWNDKLKRWVRQVCDYVNSDTLRVKINQCARAISELLC
jgi:HIV Tat-specific factor 1